MKPSMQGLNERKKAMVEATPLTLEVLEQAVGSHAAAFRCVTKLQPAGGIGDKIFPPTYEGGKYSTEERITEDGEVIQCVLLDSVQSQANRMEMALLDAVQTGKILLPLLTVRFDQERLKKKLVVTSLDAPHRVADAIFRDSLLDKVIFRKSEKGKILDSADVRNATGLFGLCPTALLFGIWDSTGPRGGLGAKFQRAIVSEIVGYKAVPGMKTSSRIDPLGIEKKSGPVFRTEDGGWTADPSKAKKTKEEKPILYKLEKGKYVAYDEKKDQEQGKPSNINHGNVTPGITPGGFTISYALQTSVISLSALRRLRFPLKDSPDSNLTVDNVARTTLVALGLTAAALAQEDGLDLRSRCQLFPTEKAVWELLDDPSSSTPKRYTIDGKTAESLFKTAVEKAKTAGLPWEGQIDLNPSDDLVTLVARSQDLAASEGAEED